jgi:mercuric ion binding protein
MRLIFETMVCAAMFAFGVGAQAVEQTVTLAVENMTCASCPYIVKQSLTRVDGVKAVDVSLEAKQAVVQYDDEKTNIEVLTAATTNYGFPSSVIK